MDQAVIEAAAVLGERAACAVVGVSRATFRRRHVATWEPEDDAGSAPSVAASLPLLLPSRQQRRYLLRQEKRAAARAARRPSSLALSPLEREAILNAAHEDRFIDKSLGAVHAILLDESTYLASLSTMYRVLKAAGETGERRNQATHPTMVKPELCASQPNSVWCWDITKLHGPRKWTYYYLYVVIDIYSRYVVGWMIADRESGSLAKLLLNETIARQGADPKTLTIHADRGSSMKSKPVAFLLADLGVTKSHSRPHVSDDNPHIEAHFKTLKYHSQFPNTFASLAQARAFCQEFFTWYNEEHRHSGIAMLRPADVHFGRAEAQLHHRQRVLDAAFAAHPERFVNGRPSVERLQASYINKPADLEIAA